MDFGSKLDTYYMPTKRPVQTETITINTRRDETNNLRGTIETLIDNAGTMGIPARLSFNIINNTNTNVTDENKILSLKVPIYPPIFSTNPQAPSWTRNSDIFIRNAKTPQSIQNSNQNLHPEAREGYIQESSELIMSYILSEIGIRYAIAKKGGDERTMDQLQSMKVVFDEDFDLDMFNLALNTPKGLSTYGERQYFTTKIGEETKRHYLSAQQASEYARHREIMLKGQDGKASAFALWRDLKSYENYDIEEAEFNQSVGGHVILMSNKNSQSTPGQNPEETEGLVQ